MKKNKLELSFSEIFRYVNQIKLCEIGLEGQKKLKKSSIAIVGAGGLGCAALLYLAGAGIGRIGVIDHDRVELSNLHRQVLYTQSHIGSYKAAIAVKQLALLNPHTHFIAHECLLTSDNALKILQDYDLVIDASDNFQTRYVIDDACREAGKPFIYGSIHHFTGQVAIFNALEFNGNKSPSYRSLYPAPPTPQDSPNCADAGVATPLPGIIGSIQALEAIKLILSLSHTLSGKLLQINTLTWVTTVYQIGPSLPSRSQPLEITVEKLQEMQVAEADLQLIDLRESLNPVIPLSQVVVLYCHTGHRSLQKVRLLRQQFPDREFYSLRGGSQAFGK